MSVGTGLARWIYRSIDRLILSHLPPHLEWWVYGGLFRLGRWGFGSRLAARTTGEFLAGARTARLQGRLPASVLRELPALEQIEPLLGALSDPAATVGEYIIPWDATHAGEAYVLLRRAVTRRPATILLTETAVDVEELAPYLSDLPEDQVLVVKLHQSAADQDELRIQIGQSVVDLRALTERERCNVLARLLIQLAPEELYVGRAALWRRCLSDYGKAIRSMTRVIEI